MSAFHTKNVFTQLYYLLHKESKQIGMKSQCSHVKHVILSTFMSHLIFIQECLAQIDAAEYEHLHII